MGQERVRGVVPTVEAKANFGSAGIIGVLNKFFEDGGAFGIVQQDLPDPPGEVYLLTEVF